MRDITVLIVVAVFLYSCHTTGGIKGAGSPPGWVTGAPGIKGMICAVGASGPTFYPEDAREYAAENARKELARTLNVDIKSIMVDMATEKGSSIDEAAVMQVSSWATSVVVENSRIMNYWQDAEGGVSQKNTTYALCCMPRRLDKQGLEEQLINSRRSDDVNLEEISRTAEEIINKLHDRGVLNGD